MDKNLSDIAQNVALAAIREAFSGHALLKDFVIDSAGGSIGAIETVLKFSLTPKVIQTPTTVFGQPITNDSVSMGYAPPGTPIVYGRDNKRGTIIKSRTKKYLFRDEANKKEYIINFGACRLDVSRMTKV